MSLWTKATLGVAAVVACAGGAAAQVGCTTCGPAGSGGGHLRGAVPNTIPRCNKHDGLTQYPLSEKRYIKQFCNPTICPGSCFGHFKTQWTPWPQACPGWGADGGPATFGPNFIHQAQPGVPPQGETAPAPTPAKQPAPAPAAEPTPAPAAEPAPAPPSRPLTAPKTTPEVPAIPMPQGGLPSLPPGGNPKF